MVPVSRNFTRDLRNFAELQQIARVQFLPKAVPSCHAVETDPAGGCCGFEKREGVAQALQEIRARNFAKLCFGIMQVEDIYARHAQIREATLHLILEKARRHAVAARDDVFCGQNPRLDVLAKKYSFASEGIPPSGVR